MIENEVNSKVKGWLQAHSFTYKGILNVGLGQVPAPLPDGSRSILIDHQGFNDRTKELLWIEAKGEGDNLSELLEGFIRLCVAVYWGGGNGYLAVPHAEYEKLLEQKDFLKAVAESVNGKGTMGLLDAEKGVVIEF